VALAVQPRLHGHLCDLGAADVLASEGVQGAWFCELFATRTRTAGTSLAYQLSAVVSGITPLIATALHSATSWTEPAVLGRDERVTGPARAGGRRPGTRR